MKVKKKRLLHIILLLLLIAEDKKNEKEYGQVNKRKDYKNECELANPAFILFQFKCHD